VGIVEMMSDARSVVTVICLLTFLGIVFWTFSAGRSAAFSEAEQLPFADEALDEPAAPAVQASGAMKMENRNG
jgi:cytochrome c oxidase cbb3-type subunit 4